MKWQLLLIGFIGLRVWGSTFFSLGPGSEISGVRVWASVLDLPLRFSLGTSSLLDAGHFDNSSSAENSKALNP